MSFQAVCGVSRLGDDAVAASSNVLLTSSISGIDAFSSSASNAQSLLQVTDSALGDVVSQVTSAISLATSAGNGTLNAANLSAIAKQVTDIRDNVVSLANSAYGGNYIFSGSAGKTKPFTLDTSGAVASVAYAGDNVVRSLATPDGQLVPENVTGGNVFTAGGSNLLQTLNQLVADLNSGDTAAVASDSSTLGSALSVVSEQRSTIGGSLSRLDTTTGYAKTQQTLLQARQSALLSADPAQVATDLKTASVQHEALLSVVATLDKTNLFDYLR